MDLSEEELKLLDCLLARVSKRDISREFGFSLEMTESHLVNLRRKIAVARSYTVSSSLDDESGVFSAENETGSLVTLFEDSLVVDIAGSRIACKPTSFRILAHLIRHRGHWVRTEALRNEVLRSEKQPTGSSVRWHVLQARRSLGHLASALHGDNTLGFMFDLDGCDRPHCQGGASRELPGVSAIVDLPEVSRKSRLAAPSALELSGLD